MLKEETERLLKSRITFYVCQYEDHGPHEVQDAIAQVLPKEEVNPEPFINEISTHLVEIFTRFAIVPPALVPFYGPLINLPLPQSGSTIIFNNYTVKSDKSLTSHQIKLIQLIDHVLIGSKSQKTAVYNDRSFLNQASSEAKQSLQTWLRGTLEAISPPPGKGSLNSNIGTLLKDMLEIVDRALVLETPRESPGPIKGPVLPTGPAIV